RSSAPVAAGRRGPDEEDVVERMFNRLNECSTGVQGSLRGARGRDGVAKIRESSPRTPAVPGRTPVGWGEPSAAPPAPRPGASDRRDVERPVAPVRRAFSVRALSLPAGRPSGPSRRPPVGRAGGETTKGPPRVRRALRSGGGWGIRTPEGC